MSRIDSLTRVLKKAPPADAFCWPQNSEAIFERVGEPKKFIRHPTANHIGLYNQEAHVQPAAEHAAAWFHTHLTA